MNKIYYIHGTMFSGKSLDLISTYTTYKFHGKEVLVLKHTKDTRDKGIIKSRMSNIEIECIAFTDECSLRHKLSQYMVDNSFRAPDVIMIDEIQFASEKHIEEILDISEYCPVMCYGLKNTYTGELFPSITKLLAISEDIREIKTTCYCCNRKATHNILLRNGEPIYAGAYLNVEGEKSNDRYFPVCRKHFYKPGI